MHACPRRFRAGWFSRLILVSGLIAAALWPQAGPRAAPESASSATSAPIALRGYDPVAYFTIGKPTPGQAEFAARHGGRTYRFATATNRDAFLRSPAVYAPQYDGFCAMGMAESAMEEGDPLLWRIIDGKLYLNVGVEVARRWRGDIPGNIAAADRNWPKMSAQSQEKP